MYVVCSQVMWSRGNSSHSQSIWFNQVLSRGVRTSIFAFVPSVCIVQLALQFLITLEAWFRRHLTTLRQTPAVKYIQKLRTMIRGLRPLEPRLCYVRCAYLRNFDRNGIVSRYRICWCWHLTTSRNLPLLESKFILLSKRRLLRSWNMTWTHPT